MNKKVDNIAGWLSLVFILGSAVSVMLPGKAGILSRFFWKFMLFTRDGATITLICAAIALVVGLSLTYIVKDLEKRNAE